MVATDLTIAGVVVDAVVSGGKCYLRNPGFSMLIIQCPECKLFVNAPSDEQPISGPCDCGHLFKLVTIRGQRTILFIPRPETDDKAKSEANSKVPKSLP